MLAVTDHLYLQLEDAKNTVSDLGGVCGNASGVVTNNSGGAVTMPEAIATCEANTNDVLAALEPALGELPAAILETDIGYDVRTALSV